MSQFTSLQTETGVVYTKVLFLYGKKKHETCSKAPVTCKKLKEFKESSGCQRCVSKLVLLKSNSKQLKHVGPTNSKLRAILPLQVNDQTRINVADKDLELKENQFTIIDDSYENSLSNAGSEDALLLIIDFNHPDLSDSEKKKDILNGFVKHKFLLY